MYTLASVLAVLSLDSVATPLVERLLAEGRLPNLAAVQRLGHGVPLIEELPGASYATLYSGRTLADHGVYAPLQWSAEEQVARPVTSLLASELEHHSLFRRLAAQGRRVLVLDPPECSPHAVAGGVLASGVQFRARILLPEWSRPDGVLSGSPRAPRAEEIFGQPTPPYLLEMRRHMLAAPARLADAAERLLGGGAFDLAWITFAAAHQAGHVLFDASLVAGRVGEADRALLQGALAEVYEKVDEALGRILARLPSGADIVVLSPKGMGRNTTRVDLLPAMVDLVLGQGRPGGRAGPHPLWWLRSCLPLSLRSAAATLLGDRRAFELAGRMETIGKDWSRTRAFVPPCDNHGFVRLNLAGRERQGSVPARDAAALAQEIAEGLLSFVDVGGEADGAASVVRIETAAQKAGSGSRVEHLPDLFVHWSARASGPIRGVRSLRFGEIARWGVGVGRSGNHCPGNWITLLPSRARVAPGAPKPARLEDVAVTVCAALGVSHADLPGAPLLLGG